MRRLGPQRLHWRAEVWGQLAEWDAEILEDIPNTRIIWRTVGGDPATGTVSFFSLGPQRVRIAHTLSLEEAHGDTSAITKRLMQDLERFRDFVERQNPIASLEKGSATD